MSIDFPPINRLPAGLLNFLGIKSGAWGPRFLQQQLQPQIALLDWYTEVYAQWFNVGTPGAAFGGVASAPGTADNFGGASSDPTLIQGGIFQVANDECWYMHELAASYSYAALENGTFSLQMTTAGLLTATVEPPQQTVCLGIMPFTTGAPAAGGRFVTSLSRKMFLPPGTQIRVISHGTTALAGTLRGTGRVTRFKV